MSVSVRLTSHIADPSVANQEPEIWIGYTKHGRNYLDKQIKAPNTEQQMIYLIEFYKLCFSSTERVMLRWLWCQRPVVQICEITPVSLSHQT